MTYRDPDGNPEPAWKFWLFAVVAAIAVALFCLAAYEGVFLD